MVFFALSSVAGFYPFSIVLTSNATAAAPRLFCAGVILAVVGVYVSMTSPLDSRGHRSETHFFGLVGSALRSKAIQSRKEQGEATHMKNITLSSFFRMQGQNSPGVTRTRDTRVQRAGRSTP